MVIVYDYLGVCYVEVVGVDLILVGDSLGNVVLGYDFIVLVMFVDMIYYGKVVWWGVLNIFLVVDLLFGIYYVGVIDVMWYVVWVIQEMGVDVVKMEGFIFEVFDVVWVFLCNGVLVMGYVGLMLQIVVVQGGLCVQGKDDDSVCCILEGVVVLQEVGVFVVVFEVIFVWFVCLIFEWLSVVIIGIGVGVYCDGQVFVYYDLLGFYEGEEKKIVKCYVDLGCEVCEVIVYYVVEVCVCEFFSKDNSFVMKDEVFDKLY